MESLTNMWQKYLKASEGKNAVHEGEVPVKHCVEMILPDFKKIGFAAPMEHQFESALTAGLGCPVRSCPSGRNSYKTCTFYHFLNLVWQPILKYIEALSREEPVQWTNTLEIHQTAIQSEMEGIVPSPADTLAMDQWVETIQQTIKKMVGCM